MQEDLTPVFRRAPDTTQSIVPVSRLETPEFQKMLEEAGRRGAEEALRNVRVTSPPPAPAPTPGYVAGGEEGGIIGVSPQLIKQLQGTVTVFNTLKEFASNPLQKAIENKVGEVAAGVIESAFTRPGPQPKRDLLDTILNSQFAYGLGAGLGQRGPELVESMGKTFGQARSADMIDGIIGKYGKAGTGPVGAMGGGPVAGQLSGSGPGGGAGPVT